MKKSLYVFLYANPYQGSQELCLVASIWDEETKKSSGFFPLLWLGEEGLEDDEWRGMRLGFFGSGNLDIPSQEYFDGHALFIGGHKITDETASQLSDGITGEVLESLRRGHLPTLHEKFAGKILFKEGGEEK